MSGKKLSSIKPGARYPEGLNSSLKSYFFKGVALSGGKADKTSVASIEYFVNKNKLFLHTLKNKIKAEKQGSADQKLLSVLSLHAPKIKYIAINAPLSLPKCVTCRLTCPGVPSCKEPEIQWHWKAHKQVLKSKKKKKLFTPYTERCAEVLISHFLEEKFDVPHALGANHAPLLARALYLKKHLRKQLIEVYPKLSLWRIGRSLGIQKSYLRFHKNAISGEEMRDAILGQIIKAEVCFIYEEDRRILVEDNQAFDAFISALTAVFKFKGFVEKRPSSFPQKEAWIEFPQENLSI